MIQQAIAAVILVFTLLDTQPAAVIHAFEDGLAGVRTNSADVHLSVDRDASAFKDLKGAEWQTVRIAFYETRPNPYFQPPDAKKGAPIDVSDVKFVALLHRTRPLGGWRLAG